LPSYLPTNALKRFDFLKIGFVLLKVNLLMKRLRRPAAATRPVDNVIKIVTD
jgi:hypothetical protein